MEVKGSRRDSPSPVKTCHPGNQGCLSCASLRSTKGLNAVCAECACALECIRVYVCEEGMGQEQTLLKSFSQSQTSR